MRPQHILVTGASGLLGAEVVARLIAAGHAVIALTHANTELVRNNGRRIPMLPPDARPRPGAVTHFAADVSEPHLGLAPATYARLGETVEVIVHSAAITDLGRNPAVYEKVNVQGTRQVLDLARAGGIPLVHVSTAYVCGERLGTVSEDELDVGQKFGTDYERSKFRAEALVRQEAANGLPAVVVRPSVVVGEQRNGVIRDFRNIYVVLKMFTEGRVRTIPGFYEAKIDLVPVGYVADVISWCATHLDEVAGRTLHAVGPAPCTLRDFSDVLAEYPFFQVPRYVSPSVFSVDALPESERMYFERIISLYVSYFRRRMVFANDTAVASAGGCPPLGTRAYLRRLLKHCLRVGYLGNPAPDLQELVAGLPTG